MLLHCVMLLEWKKMSADSSKWGKYSRWGAGPWGGEKSGFSKAKMIYLGTEKRRKVRGRNGRETERERRYPDVAVGVHIILVVDNDVAMIDTRIDGVTRWDLIGGETNER